MLRVKNNRWEKITALLQQQSEQSQRKNMPNMRTEASKLTPAWMPSQGRGSVNEPIQSSPKIRKIGATLQSIDIVTRLRNTWLGRLYRSHLKRYVVVRWVAKRIWDNLFPVYIRFSLRAAERLPLTKLSDFAIKSGIPTHKLADAALVETPQPKVFPVRDQIYLVAPHERYTFPEIFVATINNAITYGGTNLILVDGEVVCHDLYDFEHDYTSEECDGRTSIDPKSSRIRGLLHGEAPEPIAVAATFVDACASNYAHWMTEVLPRIVLFCAEDRFRGIPIVVNDGLHKNIMESLFLVAGTEHEIITLPIGRALAVNELYLTSVAGYVPFGRRTNKLSGHSHGMFSPRAFEMLRKYLGALEQKTEKEACPEKIFLRRISGPRKITNTEELEKLLVAQGYVIVEPENLTFLRQIQLFNHAKEIVSPTGAALSNAIVCKPDAQVVVLMSKHKDMIYRYWSNLLSPIGIRVSYALGSIIENRDRGIHGDYAIDANCINDLLEGFKNR
jgi:capsular polysaccharide biosynthesis protein